MYASFSTFFTESQLDPAHLLDEHVLRQRRPVDNGRTEDVQEDDGLQREGADEGRSLAPGVAQQGGGPRHGLSHDL